MPLDPSALEDGLAALTGENSPASQADAAGAWADAVEAWAEGIVPASTTVSAAAATLEAALLPAFQGTDPATFAAALETAFAAFAVTVGGGMAGYTPTPPAGPVGFAALIATIQPSIEAFAAAWTQAIDTWMRTGFSTLNAPPGTVVPWS